MLIRTEEWLAAHDAVTAADPDVTNPDHGVAVVVWSGQRHWYAWSDKVVVMTAGVDAGDEEHMEIAVQRRLCRSPCRCRYVSDVSLAVDGTRHDRAGRRELPPLRSTRHDDPSQPRWDERRPSQRRGCRLTVCVGCSTFAECCSTESTPTRPRVPSFDVSITATGLAVHIDRDAAGVPETRLNVDAKTSGSAARSVWGPGVGPAPRRRPTRRGCRGADADDQRRGDRANRTLECIDRRRRQLDHGRPAHLVRPDGVPRADERRPAPGSVVGRDVCELAKDSDPEVRMEAAASRWNWDLRLQRVLATDPDERVVRALLDHVDLTLEVFELIVGGRHVRLRRELAWRSDLRTELIERLAADDDRITRGRAASELARRAAAAGYPTVHGVLELGRAAPRRGLPRLVHVQSLRRGVSADDHDCDART